MFIYYDGLPALNSVKVDGMLSQLLRPVCGRSYMASKGGRACTEDGTQSDVSGENRQKPLTRRAARSCELSLLGGGVKLAQVACLVLSGMPVTQARWEHHTSVYWFTYTP